MPPRTRLEGCFRRHCEAGCRSTTSPRRRWRTRPLLCSAARPTASGPASAWEEPGRRLSTASHEADRPPNDPDSSRSGLGCHPKQGPSSPRDCHQAGSQSGRGFGLISERGCLTLVDRFAKAPLPWLEDAGSHQGRIGRARRAASRRVPAAWAGRTRPAKRSSRPVPRSHRRRNDYCGLA